METDTLKNPVKPIESTDLFVVGGRVGCGEALFYDDDDWVCGFITKRGQSLQFCNVCDPEYGIRYISAEEAMGYDSTNVKCAPTGAVELMLK
jgi:hypothetical protein